MARRRKQTRQALDDDAQASPASSRFSSTLVDKIEAWSEEAVQAHGLVLFDVEMVMSRRWIIRVYVDQPEGSDASQGLHVGACAEVSRYLEAYLDACDEIPEKYVLEVSSPGIERALRKPRHLQQAVGEDIQVVVRKQIDGKNKVVGKLVAYEEPTLRVLLRDGPDEPVDIDWADVKEARLKYDFDF